MTSLILSPPAVIVNKTDAENATEWLRIKRDFDEQIDAAHKEAIKQAHQSHKAALAIPKKLKEETDVIAANVRTHLEVYASNPANELPDGVFRRKTYIVTVTDPGLVPSQFLAPDLGMITAVIKRTEGAIKIPGVEFVEETGITVRSEG